MTNRAHRVDCRHFDGYKPCGRDGPCDSACSSFEKVGARILVVHLEALGAVLRSTALLPAIKRRFPGSHVTWVTQAPAQALLEGNPFVDRLLTTTSDDLLILSALEFDCAFVVDKSLKAAGVLRATRADLIFGFRAEPGTGAILPATPAAQELWEIGLDDRLKFFENRKAETQLACEALELGPWRRDEYVLRLSAPERAASAARRARLAPAGEAVIGINTGCSAQIPYKKLTVEAHRELVTRLSRRSGIRVALLGGAEDRERNERIGYGLDVAHTPFDRGLRDGLISVEACDVVVSGDSLGLHMAIALRKQVVAWFGPTCEQEIDLYGRGAKVLTKAPCSPCWKRSCARETMCYDLVSIEDVAAGALRLAMPFAQRKSPPCPSPGPPLPSPPPTSP